MSEPINLNRARKQAGRMKKLAQADVNAKKFGRSKAEKDVAAARSEKAAKDLDQHLLDGKN